MNRREVLKAAAAAGTGLLVPGWFKHDRAEDTSVFLITDRPVRDLSRIRELPEFRGRDMEMRLAPMSRSRQDLSVLRGGILVDPVRGHELSDEITHFAIEMRERSDPGTNWIEFEPRLIGRGATIGFQVDGKTIETIDRSARYHEIPIAGHQGETVFCLEDGFLSVVRSSCRHKLCQKMGRVNTGRVICAPNRLVAIVGARATAVDAITG